MELIEWWQRQRDLYPRKVAVGGLAAHGEQGLRELAKKYGAEYVVLDRCVNSRPLSLRAVTRRFFRTPPAPTRCIRLITSNDRTANAEEQRDWLAEQLRQRLAAHDWTAACYQRLRRNSVTAGIAGPPARTSSRRRWWRCSIRPTASGICP